MAKTKIEWADEVWNPVTGCTKVSQGCKNCYAETLHEMRHKAYLNGKKLPVQYSRPFCETQMHPDRLENPLHWKKPRRVFVNSMSDLFHSHVDHDFIADIFRVMEKSANHTFMILTKRPNEMLHWFNKYNVEKPLQNVWLGVSVEDQKTSGERIPLLLETPAAVRFVSCEPLLGPVDLSKWISCNCPRDYYENNGHSAWCPQGKKWVKSLDWVIVGGESGPNARPASRDWVYSLRNQCSKADVPFFFKSWGSWAPSRSLGSRNYLWEDGDIFHWVGNKKLRKIAGIEWKQFPGDE